jgi:hypothetical protein
MIKPVGLETSLAVPCSFCHTNQSSWFVSWAVFKSTVYVDDRNEKPVRLTPDAQKNPVNLKAINIQCPMHCAFLVPEI